MTQIATNAEGIGGGGQDRKLRTPVIEVMDDAMAEILAKKTEIERLKIGFRMWKAARVILRAAIHTEHPDWNEQETNREIARRISHGAVHDELG